MRKKLNKKGFTLIELVAVILILGILASIAIPLTAGVIDSSKSAVCATNRHTMDALWKMLYSKDQTVAKDDPNIVATLQTAGLISSPITCPSGGTYSLVDGEVACSVHDGEEGTGGTEEPGGGTGGTGGTDYPAADAEVFFAITGGPWSDGSFNYSITIKNKTQTTMDSWAVEFYYPGTLFKADNGDLIDLGNHKYRIVCQYSNYYIPAGDSRGTNGKGTTYNGSTISQPVVKKSCDSINAYMRWTASGTSDFSYNFLIKNNSNQPIFGWTLEFTYTGKITRVGGGLTLTNLGNNRYQITPPIHGYYNYIPASSQTDNFEGAGTSFVASVPTNATLNGVAITVQ